MANCVPGSMVEHPAPRAERATARASVAPERGSQAMPLLYRNPAPKCWFTAPAVLALLRQLLAEADHDQPFRRGGHSTTGDAGGTFAARQKGRKAGASPLPGTGILPVRSGPYGGLSYSDETTW